MVQPSGAGSRLTNDVAAMSPGPGSTAVMNRTIVDWPRVILLTSVALALCVGTVHAKPCTDEDKEAVELVSAELDARCPCDGGYRNHGRYVRCVARNTNKLFKEYGLPSSCKRTIRRCAARSTCGKEGAVRCCFILEQACMNDPRPGDARPVGVCLEDHQSACDVNADCAPLKTKCKISRSAENCEHRGGALSGSGSCCGACGAP